MLGENKTPKQKAEELAAQKARREAQIKYLKKVQTALNSAESDPNVLIVLQYLKKLSGYELNPVALNASGEVMVSSTVYNAGREAVYHDLRKLMSVETKNVVERSEV